jgi:hypothetical protein
MKNLFTQQNLVYIGIGLVTAFVVTNVLVNRQKTKNNNKPVLKSESDEENSDFCGCGA